MTYWPVYGFANGISVCRPRLIHALKPQRRYPPMNPVFCLKQSAVFYRMAVTTVCAALFLGLSGCGEKLPPGKTRIFGTVTVDGQPLTFAGEGIFAISLVAREGTEVAGNRLEKSDGSFELVLSPGDYIAVVTATDGFGSDGYDPKTQKVGKVIPPKSLIPDRYNSADSSDAVVTVPPSGGSVEVSLKSR